MNNKIITIFGATGFIGKYVVDELVKAGYTIRVVSRSFERAKLLRTGAVVGQVVPVVGDLNRPEDFAQLVEGSYGVVNLVGLLYERKGSKFNNIHNLAVEKLAVAAKRAGAQRFVHISALVDENSKSSYATTKLAGERALLIAFPEATILKPSVVFGAEDDFFNKFACMGTISPCLPLIGGGKTKFQPVYVGDVAKAVLVSLDDNKGGTYQLGGPQVLTFGQILEKIQEFTNRKRLLINMPFGVMKLVSHFMPPFIITADQVTLLKSDNVVSTRSKGFKELGITAASIESVVPDYLARFKRKSLK